MKHKRGLKMNFTKDDATRFCNVRYIKATKAAPDFGFFDPAPLFRKEFTVDKRDGSKSTSVFVNWGNNEEFWDSN